MNKGKGKKLDVSKKIKNIKVKGEYKDIYFKDLEFTIIDFTDNKSFNLTEQ